MSSIGPQIPAHLLSNHPVSDEDEGEGPLPASGTSIGPQVPANIGPEIPLYLKGGTIHDDDDDDESYGTSKPSDVNIGPQIPSHSLSKPVAAEEEEEDEDDYVPQLPPELAAKRAAPKSSTPPSSVPASSSGRRPLGPTLPSYAPTYDPNTYYDEDEDDDDDDEVGPKPLPAGMQHQETDAVKEFIEREERRKKQLEEAQNPKKLQRDEWMLIPPSSSDLLGKLDPTKLKPRQFSRNPQGAPSGPSDMSLWTETPQERQQRLADEVTGKKRRVTEQKPEEDDDTGRKRRRGDEEFIRKGVDDYTKRLRGPALVDQHTASHKGEEEDKKDKGIWDHSRDMSLGGRLMDDDKRNKIIRESKGLSDRFGTGKSGGFL